MGFENVIKGKLKLKGSSSGQTKVEKKKKKKRKGNEVRFLFTKCLFFAFVEKTWKRFYLVFYWSLLRYYYYYYNNNNNKYWWNRNEITRNSRNRRRLRKKSMRELRPRKRTMRVRANNEGGRSQSKPIWVIRIKWSCSTRSYRGYRSITIYRKLGQGKREVML